MPITHLFDSPKTDGADDTLVQAGDWNDNHVIGDEAANLVLAGPVSGGAAAPLFRSLVDADIPASIARDSELHTQVHAIGGADHTDSLTATLHGTFAGDDLHTQYLLADGSRALTADWDMGAFDIRANEARFNDRMAINQAVSTLSRLAITEDNASLGPAPAFVFNMTVSPTLGANASVIGQRLVGTIDLNGFNAVAITGLLLSAGIKDTNGPVGTVTDWGFLHLTPNVPSTGPNVTTITGIDIAPTNLGNLTGTGTAYGIRIQDMSQHGGTTYGVRIEDMGTGTRYGFYQDGVNAFNIFNAKVRIGSTDDPTVALDVAGVLRSTGDVSVGKGMIASYTGGRSCLLTAGTTNSGFQFDDAGGFVINSNLAARILVGDESSSSQKMQIDSSGRIGIPSVNTNFAFYVNSGINEVAVFQGTDHCALRLVGTAGSEKSFNIYEGATLKWKLGEDNNPTSPDFRADFVIKQTNDANPEFVITTDTLVGISRDGLAALPIAQLHVEQTSTSVALPVLLLDQRDVSEECIKFTLNAASPVDADINLFTVDVTGVPKLSWDESADDLIFNTGVQVEDRDVNRYAYSVG